MVLPNSLAKITDFVKKAYRDYFEVKVGAQDKPFTPHVWKIWGIKLMVKGSVRHFYSNDLERRKRLHYVLLFLHNKCKRNKSQYQVPCPISQCFFCHTTNPLWPVPLTWAELTCDLNLLREYAHLLGSRLKEKHLLVPGITIYCIKTVREN